MVQISEQIFKIGIIPVIAIDDAEKAVPLAKALVKGGLPAAEVTFRTAAAEEAIRRIVAEVPDMLVGAGTVLTKEQADRAIAAGSQFIVSPGFNPEITRYVLDKGVVMMPGTATPGEMEQAMSMGLDVVKFFPAEQNGGVAKLKALAGPYTNLRWMPTGGVNTKNMMDYLGFDRIIACGGTWMVKKDLIEGEQWDEITRICKEAVKTMLGFSLAHVGINCADEAQAEQTAKTLCALFDLEYKPGNSSIFAGSAVECNKAPGRGTNGHIAIAANNVDRAVYHLGLRGVTFDESSRKTDAKGTTKAILKELADLCDGPITDEELEDCRRGLLSGMNGVEDSLGGMETWYYIEVLRAGANSAAPIQTPAQARAALQAVTKEDVRSILRQLTLSVSYLLTKEEPTHA